MSTSAPEPAPPDSNLDSTPESNPASKPEVTPAWQFFAAAVGVALAIGLISAQAPPRIRLLGLFAIALGLLTSWLLLEMARRMNTRIGTLQIAWIGLVTIVGLVTSLLATVAMQPPPPPPRDLHPVEAVVVAQMRKAAEDAGLEPPASLTAPDAKFEVLTVPKLSFFDRVLIYLDRRVAMLGQWPNPWPELFWLGEVLAGTSAAIGFAIVRRQRELTS
jgi:hypothetical protein